MGGRGGLNLRGGRLKMHKTNIVATASAKGDCDDVKLDLTIFGSTGDLTAHHYHHILTLCRFLQRPSCKNRPRLQVLSKSRQVASTVPQKYWKRESKEGGDLFVVSPFRINFQTWTSIHRSRPFWGQCPPPMYSSILQCPIQSDTVFITVIE